MPRERLDMILYSRGLFESREKAKAAIMAGLVYVKGERCDKPGLSCDTDCEIEVRGKPIPYVSRGGLKLEKAINEFDIKLNGLTCVDVGASTGGFTDVMLKNGAAKVYSIDVGYGQLAWELRNDPRVICMERTNFRYITPEHIKEPIDFGSVDVSFISLRLIIPPLKALLKPEGKAVLLIKPQFEAGRSKVGKKGVVRDPKVHEEVINDIIETATGTGFSVSGLSWSPITGPEGNIEYLLYLVNGKQPADDNHISVADIVRSAHMELY